MGSSSTHFTHKPAQPHPTPYTTLHTTTLHTVTNSPETIKAVAADDHQTVPGLVPVDGGGHHVDLADEGAVLPVEEHHAVGAADRQAHAAVDACGAVV
jgi:hypothetical protein